MAISECIAAAITAGEQPALPAESHPTQSALGRIVRQANAPVIEEACERIPSLEHVIHRLRHIGMSREPAALGSHPLLERDDEWRHLGLPDSVPLHGRQSVDLTLDIEDRVDPPHRLDGQRCLG